MLQDRLHHVVREAVAAEVLRSAQQLVHEGPGGRRAAELQETAEDAAAEASEKLSLSICRVMYLYI